MSLYFITGSRKKVEEIQAIVPDVEQLEIELPEIQALDAHEILRAKLAEARNHHTGAFIVEDTSLYFDGMHGLPGPLIKWFVEALGLEGLAKLATLYSGKAVAKTLIGYADEKGRVEFFEGEMDGTIVPPQGEGYGWDAIFIPDGYDTTLGVLGVEEKNKISMRAQAAQKLKTFLDNK